MSPAPLLDLLRAILSIPNLLLRDPGRLRWVGGFRMPIVKEHSEGVRDDAIVHSRGKELLLGFPRQFRPRPQSRMSQQGDETVLVRERSIELQRLLL